MGLAGYICFMAALSVAAALLYTPSQRFLAYVHCPKYFVVRRVDYLHYRVERVHYLLRFVASGISVRAVRGPEAFAGLGSLVGAATVLNLCMEVGLRITGQRQMRLRAYSRLPSALAVLLQAFFEGGVYFGAFFAFALHLNAGDATCVLVYATAWAVFPLWSLLHGWPRPRAYGAKDHLSRREIVSTAPSRLLQVAAAAVCWRTAARPPASFLRAVATAQLCFFPWYFGALRWLGRSFVEVESSAPSALADLLCTAYRAAEPLAGAFSIVAAFALFFPAAEGLLMSK
jgi:hypothetical protein